MGIPNSFLLDEVRCGFLIPAAVKQAWAAELEVLAEIDRVCKKHNIQYFADWGTLLGAVRHGGFIPWDDDLDIVMKREDYTKFMTVARFDMEEGVEVQTYRNQKDFWLFMGKVVGKNRFCFEKEHLRKFHNFPYIACVDIFVLDYIHPDPEREEKRRTLCKYILGVADAIVEGRLLPAEWERSFRTIEELGGPSVERQGSQLSDRFCDPVEMGCYLYGEVERIFAEVPESEATTLTQLFPWGLKGTGLQFPKEYYSEQIYLPFECTKMPVPCVYDKMLRMRYGDYMKLVKDAGAHNYPFFEGQKVNLQKVLDFKLPEFEVDCSKIYRSEEEKAYANLSYKVMARECVEALQEMCEQLTGSEMQGMLVERGMNLVQESQQLAIDLGTMLEQMSGEGTVVVGLLEQYCEALFAVYQWLAQSDDDVVENNTAKRMCDSLNSIMENITTELEHVLIRKTILFLPVLARDWKGLHSLWQAAVEDPDCDTYVIPLPYYYKDYDGSPREICCDTAEFPEEICALDYKLLTAEYLEMLHPEIIVIQNPYDAWNPAISVADMFYSRNLRKYTDELVYVPPFVVEEFGGDNARACTNMKYYVPMPGVVYADKVIVQSENMRKLYIEKMTEVSGAETREIWEKKVLGIGVPAQDADTARECTKRDERFLSQNTETDFPQAPHKKHILYGISRGTCLEDPVAYQEKLERNQQIFAQYQDSVDVTMFQFPEEAEATGKSLDIREFDAYYGDAMPIVVEFTQAGKPVMIQNIFL